MSGLALGYALADVAGQAFRLRFLDAEDWDLVGAEEDGDVTFACELLQGQWAVEERDLGVLCSILILRCCFYACGHSQVCLTCLFDLRGSSFQERSDVALALVIAGYRGIQMVDGFIPGFERDAQPAGAVDVLRLLEAIADDVLKLIALLLG